MNLEQFCANIEYEDFIINTLDKTPIIDQYVSMFKIGCLPYAYDIQTKLNNIEDIIAAIIMYIRFNHLKPGNVSSIEGYDINIQNELLPSIISEFKKTRQKNENLEYLVQREQNPRSIKMCEEDFIIRAVRKSINK